jgi:hypothetical protein
MLYYFQVKDGIIVGYSSLPNVLSTDYTIVVIETSTPMAYIGTAYTI